MKSTTYETYTINEYSDGRVEVIFHIQRIIQLVKQSPNNIHEGLLTFFNEPN